MKISTLNFWLKRGQYTGTIPSEEERRAQEEILEQVAAVLQVTPADLWTWNITPSHIATAPGVGRSLGIQVTVVLKSGHKYVLHCDEAGKLIRPGTFYHTPTPPPLPISDPTPTPVEPLPDTAGPLDDPTEPDPSTLTEPDPSTLSVGDAVEETLSPPATPRPWDRFTYKELRAQAKALNISTYRMKKAGIYTAIVEAGGFQSTSEEENSVQ